MTYRDWRRFEIARALIFVLVALAVAMLSGCALPGDNGKQSIRSVATVAAATADAAGAKPPALAEITAIDEKLLSLSARAVTVAAKASSALVRTGVITRGSPTALRLAHWLDVARDAVLAAEQARLALSADSYREALARADEAVTAIMAIISPHGG